MYGLSLTRLGFYKRHYIQSTAFEQDSMGQVPNKYSDDDQSMVTNDAFISELRNCI